MRNKLLYICLVAAIVCLCLMRWLTAGNETATDDEPTLALNGGVAGADADEYVTGYIGDGTGMSCIEFVTESGDTLLLSRTSEYTGEDGIALGTMQTETTNLYAVHVADNGETAGVVVNLTELRQRWHRGGQGFVLAADSTASPIGKDAPRYRRWRLHGDCLVMAREARIENGVTEVTDTLRIVSLTPDTLVLRDHFGDDIKYWH